VATAIWTFMRPLPPPNWVNYHSPKCLTIFLLWLTISPLTALLGWVFSFKGDDESQRNAWIMVALMAWLVAYVPIHVMNFFWWICHIGDPGWRALYARDWSMLNSLPWCPDSEEVENGGRPQPKTKFTPPRTWTYRCDGCGARVAREHETCWNCKRQLGRPFTCSFCGTDSKEAKYGGLDRNGVICPACDHVMTSSTILENTRRFLCAGCGHSVLAGQLENGSLVCPFCQHTL